MEQNQQIGEKNQKVGRKAQLIQRIDQLLIIIERLKQQRWKMELLRQMFQNIEAGGEIETQIQQILRKDLDDLNQMYSKQEDIFQILLKRENNINGHNLQLEQERLMNSCREYEKKCDEFLIKIKGYGEEQSTLSNYLSQFMNTMDHIQGLINDQK